MIYHVTLVMKRDKLVIIVPWVTFLSIFLTLLIICLGMLELAILLQILFVHTIAIAKATLGA